MSCCPPEKGLAALAENPGIILFSYLCALLPLAAIYALDFINKDWKSVRHTRRVGKFYLSLSIPLLGVVFFYIHLQKVAGDYKEMATAITAAILCILHILRTVWGLVQLHAFKKWNMHALRTLARMGFYVPIYVSEAGEKRMRRRGSDSTGDGESNLSVISKNFTRFVDNIRRTLGLEKLLLRYSREPTANDIGRTVDMHMVVNNSLVDNEFIGAELPCQFNFSFLRHAFRMRTVSVADLLTPKEPEECCVRWSFAFLARFGSEWLMRSKRTTKVDASNRLLAFIACIVTHSVDTQSEGGGTMSQEVSNLSPLHVLCSDLVKPWVSWLKVPEENHLPYQMRGRSEANELDLDDYRASIRNCISAWHKISLNEISNEEQKSAVSNMSADQVAWFCKLIEEKNSNFLPLDEFGYYGTSESAFQTFIWQLGYPSETFDLDNIALPVLKKSLYRMVDRHAVLQASVHVDNWLALEADNFPSSFGQIQTECSDVEQVFSTQKRIELQRLKFELASNDGENERIVGKMKFVGCLMEWVRSSLAFWLDEGGIDSECSDEVWTPRIAEESCTVVCSDQLNEAFEEAASENEMKAESAADSFERRSLQMRVLWEIQQNLMRVENGGPSSPSLMMLCMLAYPSLRMSKVGNCARVRRTVETSNSRHTIVRVDSADEMDGGRSGLVQSVGQENSTRNCSEENYLCYRIDIVEAPQELHILFQWNSSSKKATVRIGWDERGGLREFCWQSWKDGFMGRICAQSEWRLSHLRDTVEAIRTEAFSSKVVDGIDTIAFNSESDSSSESFQSEISAIYWKGWPPFLTQISVFEAEVTGHLDCLEALDAFFDMVFEKQQEDVSSSHNNETEGEQQEVASQSHGSETEGEQQEDSSYSHDTETEGGQEEDASRSHGNQTEGEQEEGASNLHNNDMMRDASSTEMECKCGCEGHDMFLKAKEELMMGKEEEVLDTFRFCVAYYKHSLALEEYISILTRKSSMHTELIDKLLSDVNVGLDSRPPKTTCRKFKQYDMEKVIELLGTVFEKSGNEKVLYQKARMLFIRSQNGESADERCIGAFESYLLLENADLYYSIFCHFYLALCYFQKYGYSGHQLDEDIGVQYCLRLSTESRRNILSPTCMAFLLGKGSVSRREFENIDVPEPLFPDWFTRGFSMERILKHIFLRSSDVGYRISRNAKAACAIYEDIISHREKYHSYCMLSYQVALNRLGLIYHKGTDGISQNLKKAEELYTKAIEHAEGNLEGKKEKEKQRDVHRINAMNNLAVLYGQRENDVESGTRSRELFKDAIEQFEKLEGEGKNEGEEGSDSGRTGKHSTSINNLAVLMEAENDIAGAKELYLRSVAIDENPVAKYNLAVLLKFEDRSGENTDEAEKLFCEVSDVGVDLQSTPVLWAELEKARGVAVSETSGALPFKVEEVDDCLAYVKVVDSSR